MYRTVTFTTAAVLLFSLPVAVVMAEGNADNPLGEVASPAIASRTITIQPGTAWVEVKNGEVVKFAIGDQVFAWRFDGMNTLSEIDLNKIVPAGTLNHMVQVYINRTPDYDGA
jgi:hypothetical protein